MYLYNVTFMVERESEGKLLMWLRSDEVVKNSLISHNSRVMKVVAVPDDPEFGRQALSVSLQIEFNFLADARDWGRSNIDLVTESFHQQMGGQALHFVTILKEV